MMNTLVNHANSAADRWTAWVLATSLDTAVLLVIVGLVWLAIRRRAAPQVGYCLFLLVPLKLLMPLSVTVPMAVAQWTPSVAFASLINRAHPLAPIENHLPVTAQATASELELPVRHIPPSVSPAQPRSNTDRPEPHTSPIERKSRRELASNATPPTSSRLERTPLSVAALAMIAWLGGVLILAGRLARNEFRFRARLNRSSLLDQSRLSINLGELCRRARVSQAIRIVESDAIAAPSVCGIARPAIILPRGIAASLTAEQLRWALLHELAHVGRRDLIVVWLQRLAAILQFFNPVIWIANRIVHRLREFACDDLAVSLGDVDGIESGEAFLRILRHAGQHRRGLQGALGVFGLDSRASCFLRVRRLLDTERPIRIAPRTWSLGALALLALVSLPHLHARGGAPLSASPTQPNQKVATGDDNKKDDTEFELSVVGPDGKPIPETLVEIRTNRVLTTEQVRRGKYVKRAAYGTLVATDTQGQLVVALPPAPDHFNIKITIPGFGPYWAAWSSENHKQPIPPRFTAELEPAWSVGGVIVDDTGKPVEGATVTPSIEFKKRPGDTQQLGIGVRLKTDAAGKWRFDSVPASKAALYMGINHPNFKPLARQLKRRAFGIERGQEPTAKIALERGLTVVGKVIDQSGKPIVGALVRTKFDNDIREAKTAPDGSYSLVGCAPRPVKIVVSAKDRATDMKELNIQSGMAPVDFQMKPGGTVRIRVLDATGKPVPKARIFFQRWRGRFSYFEFDHVNQYADDNGVWVWHEAPLDEFAADICPPDGMELQQQPLIARDEEYVFRVPGALVVSGNVIDATTKKPINDFRVVPGGRDNQDQMFWDRKQSFAASKGRYQIRQNRADSTSLIRIEADGYQAVVSRDIKSDEGSISIDFELKPGKNVAAKVVTPRNIPAAQARVALGIPGSQISIKNGDIDEISTFCAQTATDDAGRFHFPAQDRDFQLVITHPSGYAHIKSTPEWELTRIIHLEPWARVEGTFRVGQTPTANVPITINVNNILSYANDAPKIFTQHEVITGPGGRFIFDRVFAGTGRIGRQLTLTEAEGATEVTSVYMKPATFFAGKTIQIDLGGTGRPVVGKLRPPAGFSEKVRWNFALVSVGYDVVGFKPESLYFTASVDHDGTFRIDDVPPGDYSLSARLERDQPGRLRNHRFTVSPGNGDLPAQPVDLGVLTLEKP
jgi:beta-lactamase regulating signal transducer with metallopeptidase domain